ncbi:MAG: hypothetical protein ACRDWD_11505, partial [Acidimicrobiia bacterium]
MTQRLDVGATLRRAVELCKAEWRILVGLTIVVEIPILIADTASIRFLDIDVSRTAAVESVAAGLILVMWTTLAHHLLLAVVERVEASARRGHPRPVVGKVLRDLPIGRLLLADVLVTVALVVGLLLLVIPGIAVAVWTAPLFPLLTMERKRVLPTVRRSIAIVRGSAWRVLAVIGLLYIASQLAGLVVAALLHDAPIIDAIAHVGVVLVFEPLSSAAIVIATFALVDLDAARRSPVV